MGKYQKNIEAARRISVMQYLETYHPGELVRKTDKEYCTKTHSSLVITPANGLFHWFSQSKGGNNALDYLVKVEGMDVADEKIGALAEFPHKFEVVSDKLLSLWGIRFTIVMNYLAFYTVDDATQTVHIVRFLYGKSNWITILKTDAANGSLPVFS